MAQEALQAKEGPRDGKPLPHLDLSEPASDQESEEDPEILFTVQPRGPEGFLTPPRRIPEVTDYDIVNMVRTLNGAIATVSQDTTRIQQSCRQLCAENLARDKALADLTAMVEEYGSSPEATRPYGRSPGTTRIQPTIRADVMDGEGNLRAADIGIVWEGGETFPHGVKVVSSPSTQPVGSIPIVPTSYPPVDVADRRDTPTTVRPATLRTPNQDDYVRRATPEVHQG